MTMLNGTLPRLETKQDSTHVVHKNIQSIFSRTERWRKVYAHNLTKDPEGFVFVPQGKMATISSDRSPKNIEGLYTDDFTSCNVIAITDKHQDITQTTLIHVDGIFLYSLEKIQQVISECRNKKPEIVVFRRNAYGAPVLFQFIKELLDENDFLFTEEILSDKVTAVSVTRDGKIIKHPCDQIKLLMHTDHYKIRLARTTHQALLTLRFTTVQPSNDTPYVYQVDHWEKTENNLPPQILELPKAKALANKPGLEGEELRLRFELQQLLNCNDQYDVLFLSNIKAIIQHYKQSGQNKFILELEKICQEPKSVTENIIKHLQSVSTETLDENLDLIFGILGSLLTKESIKAHVEFSAGLKPAEDKTEAHPLPRAVP